MSFTFAPVVPTMSERDGTEAQCQEAFMSTTTIARKRYPKLVSSLHEIDTSPARFGELRISTDILDDADALRQRMLEDGYLFLPGYLDRDLVLEARNVITDRLAAEGSLAPGTAPMDAVAREGITFKYREDLADDNEPLDRLLYSGRMIAFYERFLGGPVRHFDYTWLRSVAPGIGTPPHGDSVFMNRGTTNLYTAWVPLGDISFDLGGLIVLEHSHRLDEVKNSYGRRDVDTYCENKPDAELYATGEKSWDGALSHDPFELREQLGLRWLTTEFKAGDLLTFTMYTLHGSLDNQSEKVRISSDSRYQPASEPVDARWVGAQRRTVAERRAAGRRGRIC